MYDAPGAMGPCLGMSAWSRLVGRLAGQGHATERSASRHPSTRTLVRPDIFRGDARVVLGEHPTLRVVADLAHFGV
jgi:hypothetical protein